MGEKGVERRRRGEDSRGVERWEWERRGETKGEERGGGVCPLP